MAASHLNPGNSAETLGGTWPERSRVEALAQLDRIVSSAHFRSSKRCSLFLRYVVEHATGNDFERLKERTIGVEVFERAPHYDTNQDPVVRIAAGEVRKRLAQYYQEPGHEQEPRITLPAGSYVPALEMKPVRAEAVIAPVSEPAVVVDPKPVAVADKPVRMQGPAFVAGVALCSIAAAVALFVPWFRGTELDRFWAPVVQSAGPVLVCMGQPKAYLFRTDTQADLDRWFATNQEGRVAPAKIQSVPLSEFYPAWNRTISLADATAFSRLSGLLGRAGKAAILRGGRSLSLSDLRGRPVVLIGAFNNDWTLNLAGELRYYFDSANGAQLVRDRQNKSKADWSIRNSWPELKIPMDYAIVSRVRNPVTEQLVVTAAGLTSYGTEAAGEFVTNPAYFAEAVRNLPADWARKNIQVVLSTPVLSGTAGPPKVVAVHVW